ncbi:hypothetical protein BC829DRAFT_398244, partial [Chytridium lagenaria]
MPPQPLTTHLPPSSSALPISPLKRKTELSVHIPVMVSSLRGRKEVREVGGGVKGVKKWSRAESAHSISSTGTAHSFAETIPTLIPNLIHHCNPLSTTLSTLTTTLQPPPQPPPPQFDSAKPSSSKHYSKTEYDRRPSTQNPSLKPISCPSDFSCEFTLSTNPVDVRRDVEVGGDVVERLTEAAR